MRRLVLGLSLATAGCVVGGTGDDEISCSRSARTGRYLVQYAVASGTCGPVPSEVVRFEDGALVAEGNSSSCIYGEPDFRNGDCSAFVRVTCAAATGTTTVDLDLSQADDDGASLSGSATVRVQDTSGNVSCTGTYRVTATRESS